MGIGHCCCRLGAIYRCEVQSPCSGHAGFTVADNLYSTYTRTLTAPDYVATQEISYSSRHSNCPSQSLDIQGSGTPSLDFLVSESQTDASLIREYSQTPGGPVHTVDSYQLTGGPYTYLDVLAELRTLLTSLRPTSPSGFPAGTNVMTVNICSQTIAFADSPLTFLDVVATRAAATFMAFRCCPGDPVPAGTGVSTRLVSYAVGWFKPGSVPWSRTTTVGGVPTCEQFATLPSGYVFADPADDQGLYLVALPC